MTYMYRPVDNKKKILSPTISSAVDLVLVNVRSLIYHSVSDMKEYFEKGTSTV